MGVANERSIAWGIAKACHDQGAEVAFTLQGEALEKRVRSLASSIGAKFIEPCDVTNGAWIHVQAEGQGQGQPQAPDAIVADSPAADAGLKAEDIITAIDGQVIDREHPLDLVLLTHGPGDTVTLTVLRDGTSQDIEVTLGTRPADAQ